MKTVNPNKKIRTLIVDDEEGSRRTLYNLLKEYCPQVEIIDMADSASAAYKSIQTHQPELVFLDVRMPAADEGFQLLESLEDINFALVFTTSFDEYALRAIKFSALDYLLKPINILELQKAVSRYEKRMGSNDQARITNFQNNKHQDRFNKIGLPGMDGLTFVPVQDIIRCEADGNCTLFFLKGGQKIMVTKTLKYYHELLNEAHFYRVHGSHLINMKHIVKYLREGTVEMSDGSEVFVSARKKKGFLETLQKGNYRI